MSPLKGADSLTPTKEIQDACISKHSKSWMLPDPFYEEKLPQLLGKNFAFKGKYTTAFFAYPKDFHPFNNDAFVSTLWELCTGSIGQLQTGHYETICPALAESMSEDVQPNEIIYHITLHPETSWQEVASPNSKKTQYCVQTPLTSSDFKLFVNAFKNSYVNLPKAASLRKRYQSLKEIRIIDDKHFDVIWDKAAHLDYELPLLTAQLRPLPAHVFLRSKEGEELFNLDQTHTHEFARHFSDHWAKSKVISCGPWVMKSKNLSQIVLERNPHFHHPYAALMEQMVFNYKSSAISAWQAFKAKELTSCYLSPMQLEDGLAYVDQAPEAEMIEYFAKIYYFVGWNQNNPLFESPKVRRALSLAIDRERLIQHFLKGQAQKLSGPIMPSASEYNSEIQPHPYDPKKAIQLLEEEGWHQHHMHAAREKNMDGKSYALRFHLTYFLQSELSLMVCQYVSACLKEIGVECQLQGLNYSEFMQRYQNKTFDAIYMGWSLSPPPMDLAPMWHSKEADKIGSSNIIGFKDDQIDSYLETLKGLTHPQQRLNCYHKIHERIDELSPYAFLFVPKQIFVYRRPLSNVFLPKNEVSLFENADIEELCPKIFYFSSKDLS